MKLMILAKIRLFCKMFLQPTRFECSLEAIFFVIVFLDFVLGWWWTSVVRSFIGNTKA